MYLHTVTIQSHISQMPSLTNTITFLKLLTSDLLQQHARKLNYFYIGTTFDHQFYFPLVPSDHVLK